MKVKVLYKTVDNRQPMICTDCGKHISNCIWIGFDENGEVVESPYGSGCAKKYKIGEQIDI